MPIIKTAPKAFLPIRVSKTVTFTGAAGLGGLEAAGNVPLFTVTGEVLVRYIVPYVLTGLAGATATLALGVTNWTAVFIAATTATLLAAGEFWTEATGGCTPDSATGIPAALKEIAVTSNIVGTVATAAITGGVLRLDVYYLPLSSDGLVVAA